MTAFEERLKTFAHLQLTEKPFDPVNAPVLDIRAPRLIVSHGMPCGVTSAQAAAALVSGCESNRLLFALHGLLTQLVDASPEEIPLRLRELIGAYDTITAHLDESLTAIEQAQKEMFEAAPTSAELNRRTH